MEDPVAESPGARGPRSTGAAKRQMRKGTRACTSCRRRKIRCIFRPEDSATCMNCSDRGIQCVSQGGGLPDNIAHSHSGGSSPSRSAVLPRRSRFQSVAHTSGSLLRFAAPRHQSAAASDEATSDFESPGGQRPPLVAALDESFDDACMAGSATTPILPSALEIDGSVCHLLRAQLPSYDDIIATISSNGHWWDSFWMKTHTISQIPNSTPVDSLLSFTAQAYTSPDPAQLATLAVAYVRCLNRSHRLLATVEGLVMSDLRLVSTIAGMDCLVLLGKTYTDIGQPRRAWMIWRKGLAIAQMMNLHRLDLNTPGTRQRIWWAIYHGDRFTSLLLNLPHGFNDAHLEQSLEHADRCDADSWLAKFIHNCAVMAGGAIDSSMTRPSFAKAMLLDEKMDAIYNSAPSSWWHAALGDDQLKSRMQLQELVERLLIHIFFFHIRMYIHLPLLKSSSDQRPDQQHKGAVSRRACGEAAHQILYRYFLLRTDVDGHSLFDCKTTDFVAFTAAVVILITRDTLQHSPVHPEDDGLDLVQEAYRLFQAAEEKEPGCKLTVQCRVALSVLLGHVEDGTDETQEITIPYFGKVLRRRVSHASHTIEETEGGDRLARDISGPAEPSVNIAADSRSSSWVDGFNIDFTELQVPSIWDESMVGDEGIGGMNASSPSWFDMASLDIDQDWSLFDI